MRPQVIVLTLAAASANNIALSQSPVSGTPLTLNGSTVTSGVATLDAQRRVLLTYGDESAPRTMVISGTMQSGVAITETLAIPSGAGGTVATEQDFYTVTSAVPEGDGWTADVTLGTNAVGSTPWIILDPFMGPMEIGFEVELLSGGATATIETTTNSPLPPLSIYTPGYAQTQPIPTPFPLAAINGVNGNTQAGLSGTGVAAWRLTLGAGAGSWRATALQTGIIN